MSRTRVPLPAALAKAARQFDAWRRRRTKRVIPPDLWRLATGLAGCHGVSATARALRLDYYGLGRRLEQPAPGAQAGGPAPAFVEIVSALPASANECVVEFEDARGTRMRVTWKACGAPDLAALGRVFLGRPA